MLNKRFLLNIPKDKFIIWWSTAIKKQIANFRDTDDLDIMCDLDILGHISKLKDKFDFTLTESTYAEYGIFILNFKDKTKIDIIIHNDISCLKTKLIDGYNFLDILSIIWYKMNLINNNIERNLNKDNKHLKDIFWLYSNYIPFITTLK